MIEKEKTEEGKNFFRKAVAKRQEVGERRM
jgi:hypothetical protein